MAIFAIAAVMVIWLACAEPIYEIIHLKKHPNPEVEVGDIVVQQVIHTIEYILGCISHTASYLRLWALSLAHSQLAEVFFEQLIGLSMGLVTEGSIVTYFLAAVSMFVTYGGFFGATIGVLCLMEYLSAFLHCLRLAWIEFNSKFFVAEGYEFEGFALPDVFPLEVSAEITRNE